MEDSVTESEIKREIERKQGDREGEDVPSNKRDEEEIMEGGFINQFISNLVSPSSSPKSRETYVGGKMEEVEAEVEETQSGEGIINKISNFFHQENEDGEKEKEIDEMKVEEEGEEKKVKGMEELDNGGGGRINNLISNFFHQNEGEGEGGDVEKGTDTDQELINGKGDVAKEQESKMKVESANGGIINNLVSNLTASLPDSTVPANDEASILIHSIIHD